jgi:hypothetical protein
MTGTWIGTSAAIYKTELIPCMSRCAMFTIKAIETGTVHMAGTTATMIAAGRMIRAVVLIAMGIHSREGI